MKKARRCPVRLALSLVLLSISASAQEIELPLADLQLLTRGLSGLDVQSWHLEQNDQFGELEPGQWTNIDRLYRTERFRAAMEYVAINGRTDLLGKKHKLISCYYRFLDDHPIVRQAGIRWQDVAAEVVLAISAADTGAPAYDLLTGLDDALNDRDTSEDLSPTAREFLDGTASALVARDVTLNVYGPLIRDEIPIPSDPFSFDAETLRREQLNPQVLRYYSSFTEKDQSYINHKATRLYATFGWGKADDYDVTSARDRIFLGLRKMGYPESRIQDYLNANGIR